jgi:hypothetical protein
LASALATFTEERREFFARLTMDEYRQAVLQKSDKKQPD